MFNILVAGGFNEEAAPEDFQQVQQFVAHLGEQIIRQGHVLLTACRTTLDCTLAKSAHDAVIALNQIPEDRIRSYVCNGEKPAHAYGSILTSLLTDWELGNPGLRVPEPIELADVVILVGGFRGTHRAANWARIAGKAILPIRRFGGAAEKIYEEELSAVPNRFSPALTRAEFESLSQITPDLAKFAAKVVSLAEKAKTSSKVFVVMSFSGDLALEDAYESYKTVCAKYGYDCERIDEESDVERILPELLRRIAGCAFVIVDLSEPRTNVYYELGYADGIKKPLIVTAKKGSELPFDAKDLPVLFWDSQKTLRERLIKKVAYIAERQGRSLV